MQNFINFTVHDIESEYKIDKKMRRKGGENRERKKREKKSKPP